VITMHKTNFNIVQTPITRSMVY